MTTQLLFLLPFVIGYIFIPFLVRDSNYDRRDLFLSMVIACLIGARVSYVLCHLTDFLQDISILIILRPVHLNWIGGIVFSWLYLFIFTRQKREISFDLLPWYMVYYVMFIMMQVVTYVYYLVNPMILKTVSIREMMIIILLSLIGMITYKKFKKYQWILMLSLLFYLSFI